MEKMWFRSIQRRTSGLGALKNIMCYDQWSS